MTPIQQCVYDAVKELQEKCKDEHRAPVCAPLPAIISKICDDVKTTLNGFIADETMVWYKNVNGIPMFQIKDK